ncbi:MAG: universal stress protein [Bacteroidales bacterium]|nr:universal stress protein [Bacteroidales bacterium]
MENKERRTILVPFDFTPLSDYALQHGIQFAKMLDTDVTLLHVIQEVNAENLITEKLNFW